MCNEAFNTEDSYTTSDSAAISNSELEESTHDELLSSSSNNDEDSFDEDGTDFLGIIKIQKLF